MTKATTTEAIAMASEKANRRIMADWKAASAWGSASSRGVPTGTAGTR